MGQDSVDIRELIARLNANERLRQSSHFSTGVYRDEPIVRTGRQMANYLPDRYREMRRISRWQERSGEARGRWLSEAELFYRQARFMEDFEDDCPYHGRFASYYPTYNDMSDRQLRGYFTWRAAVRRGEVRETSLSFACIYLYELLNGIGWKDPADGFAKIREFWKAYRTFDTGIDRNARVWLHDFAIYHALGPELLADDPVRKLDLELIGIARAFEPYDPPLRSWLSAANSNAAEEPEPAGTPGAQTRRRNNAPALPLPPDTASEQRMFDAIAAHAGYRVDHSRLYAEHPDDFRHVLCAVFVRMLTYYRKNRSHGLVESSFGEEAEMGYTMFGSAVFFEEQPHADADYELDPIHRYRCRGGLWTCRRIYGGQGRSKSWGEIARAVDGRLRQALGFEPTLTDAACPKYLAKIIDREIDAWLAWKRDHAPRVIDIDLSKLSGIRTAAAETREALLVDEEREDEGAEVQAEPSPAEPGPDLRAQTVLGSFRAPHESACGTARGGQGQVPPETSLPEETAPACSGEKEDVGRQLDLRGPSGIGVVGRGRSGAAAVSTVSLAEDELAYLRALLCGEVPVVPAGASEDLLVDGINEKLFDLLGDTAVEFGAEGPCLIDDYRDDVRELMQP